MTPDLVKQLGLAGYGPHTGMPYDQQYATPGTVSLPVPTTVTQADDPRADVLNAPVEQQRQYARMLDDLFATLARANNQYEIYGPVSVGGKSQASLGQVANVTGTGSIYSILNPFDTDGEWSCISANFGAAGQAVLSNDPTLQGPPLSVFYDGSSIVRSIVFFASGVANLPLGRENWFPIQASDSLFWSVNMTTPNTSSAIVTVMFRRRLDRHGRPLLTNR